MKRSGKGTPESDEDDDLTAALSDGEDDSGNKQDIKQEPDDSLETKSSNESDDTLDNETNKNLSNFLHTLISAHNSNENTPESTPLCSVSKTKSTAAKKSGWTPPPKVPKVGKRISSLIIYNRNME